MIMNGLFRLAFRALCWGLIVAVSVTTVVMAKGIHPDVMVTFQPKADPQPEMFAGTNPRIRDEEPRPPEFYARAETPSRRDASGESGFEASQFPKPVPDQPKSGRLRQSKKSLSVAPIRDTDATLFGSEPPGSLDREPNYERLPPPASELDAPEPATTVTPDETAARNDLFEPPVGANESDEPAETPLPAATNGTSELNDGHTPDAVGFEQSASPDQAAPQTPAVQIPSPPEAPPSAPQLDKGTNADSASPTTESPEPSPSLNRQTAPPAIEKAIGTQESPQSPSESLPTKPVLESQPIFSEPINTPESGSETPKASKPQVVQTDSAVVDRLAQMQRQLDQIALKQQQDRDSAQSLFETSQLYQQRRLEQKLQGVEQGLRALRTERSQTTMTPPAPASLPAITSRRTASVATAVPIEEEKPQVIGERDQPTLPLVKEEQPGPDGEKRFSVNSQHGDLRELLDALAKKADLKLVLAINVSGNVELNLQSVTADEALQAIKKSTGYAVEKSGRKIYVSQPTNISNQRPVFLPPIIRPAKDRTN